MRNVSVFIALLLLSGCGKTIVDKRFDTSEIIRNNVGENVVLELYRNGIIAEGHILAKGTEIEFLESSDGPTPPFISYDSVRVVFKNGLAKTDVNCQILKAVPESYKNCGHDSVSLFNSERYTSVNTSNSLKWTYVIGEADLAEAK